MQAIEHFMRELLAARVSEEERILESWIPFRRRFFTPDCAWDNREGTLQMLRSEEFDSVSVLDSKANVITSATNPSRSVLQKQRLRYHLTVAENSWRVWHVEIECPNCGGRGDRTCIICHGNHWV
jgi:hypothetical protein